MPQRKRIIKSKPASRPKKKRRLPPTPKPTAARRRASQGVTHEPLSRTPKMVGAVPEASAGAKARRRFSTAERVRILKTAEAEHLTAKAVERRFGVKPVTYYSWRKYRSGSARGTAKLLPEQYGLILAQLRQELRTRIETVLPAIIEDEVQILVREAMESGR